MARERRSANSNSRRATHRLDVPWLSLVALLLVVILLDALLRGEWVFAFGMVISGLGAGSYHLYADRNRADRRLWIAANGLLTVGIVVLLIGAASS